MTPYGVEEIIIGSSNGLVPVRHQAIISGNVDFVSIGLFGDIFQGNVKNQNFLVKQMRLKMASGKWWPFCSGQMYWLMSWYQPEENIVLMTKAE